MKLSAIKFSKKYIFSMASGLLLVILLSQGFLGEGIDVVNSYNAGKGYGKIFLWGGPTQFIGGIIATFTFNGFYLGVFITCSLLLLSLRYYYSIELKLNPLYYSLFIFLTMLSWPLFLGATNALRQGVAVIAFVAICGLLKSDKQKKSVKLLMLMLPLGFSHSYGHLLLANLLIFFIFNRIKFLPTSIAGIFSGLVLLSLAEIFDNKSENYLAAPSGFSMEKPLVFIILTFLTIYTLCYKNRHTSDQKLLIFSIISLTIFSMSHFNNTLIFERLMWVPLIATILLTPNLSKCFSPLALSRGLSLIAMGLFSGLTLYAVGFRYY